MQSLVGALLFLTLVLPTWQHFGMTRVFEVSAQSGHAFDARDDRQNDGASVASIERKGGNLVLNCELVKKFSWPYCGFFFALGKEAAGVDLSGFDSFSVDIADYGLGPHRLRAYIWNFEPGRSTVGIWQSQKINEIEFSAPKQGIVDIPVKLLRTSEWLNSSQNVPLQHTDARIDNVTAIELHTGNPDRMGPHRLELKSIQFHGKWISQNNLLMLLVAAWFCCGAIWVALAFVNYRAEIRLSKARLASLMGINHALHLEAKELAGQAYIDPLTGALNRQGLRDMLMRAWKTPSLIAEPSSVMFVDLDNFKQTNDKHGHDVGDEVLRRFAAMVRREVRSTDKLVRWGGEEFLIVCPSTDARSAQILAEKLRAEMAHQVWPCGLHTTASFGVTAMVDGEDIGEAIKRADVALYRAKANGKNCVEVAVQTSSRCAVC